MPVAVAGIERDRHAGGAERLDAASGADDELRVVSGVHVAQEPAVRSRMPRNSVRYTLPGVF